MTHHRFSRLLLALAVAAGTTACTAPDNGTVIVLSSWPDAEHDAFVDHVLAGFTKETGIKVQHRMATRAIDQELQKDLQTGTQPNIAILSSPGQVETFAAQGALQPLETTSDTGRYGTNWLSVDGPGQSVRSVVPVKASLKSVIWYNPTALRRLLGPGWDGKLPATWAELMSLSGAIIAHGGTPWCVGLESTPVSGWPGTDWIEDLLLHQAGPEIYRQWANGTLSWAKSPELAAALTAWGDIVAAKGTINGGTEGALLTGFGAAGKSLFSAQPGCYLHHTAYIDNSSNTLQPGIDFDFFPFPAANPQLTGTREVSADFAAMFQRTPQAERLMQFLASDTGQRIWPAIPGSGAFSPSRTITPDGYPDPVSKRIAQILTQPGTVCFDASDLMPPSLNGAFNQAMLTYVSDPDPAKLGALLDKMDKVQASVRRDGATQFRCGRSG
jgi:alpha-glucoside transport system substrate-binding protein